jgi:methyl-accepting chemotaxis protein
VVHSRRENAFPSNQKKPQNNPMSLKNLSLNKKLISTFLALMSVCLIASAVVYWQGLNSAAASRDQMQAQAIAAAVGQALEAQMEEGFSQRGYLLSGDAAMLNAITVARDGVVSALSEARKQAAGFPAMVATLDEMLSASSAYKQQVIDPQIKARHAGGDAAPAKAPTEATADNGSAPLVAFRAAATRIKAQVADLIRATGETQQNSHTNLLWTLLIGGAVAGIISVGLIWLLSRAIVSPIVGMTDAMSALAAGNHDIAVPALDRGDEVGQMAKAVAVFKDAAIEKLRLSRETEDMRVEGERERQTNDSRKAHEAAEIEFAMNALADGLSRLADGDVATRLEKPFASHLDRLRVDFNQALEKLQDALQSVGRNASAINAGAVEIRSATDDLAKRTERQAASVEQTAAAVEEVTTTVKDSAKRAEDVGQRVERARRGAEKSGEVVRRAVAAMEGISKSSSEIINIISVIDDIAFQTNLLALNAGVEAARAGEAGKGFAVVAQEVRELAQRSANAAKEIKTLITTSSNQVDAGVSLVGETGEALQAIVVEVEEINENIKAIVISSREQATGLQEINTAVGAMDHNTQQNAAMVEEQTAASHALAREASELDALLRQFKLGGTEAQRTFADVRTSAPASSRPLPPAPATRTRPSSLAAGPQAITALGRPASAGVAIRPKPSPANALHTRLASAFSTASPAVKSAPKTAADNWEEF